MTEGANKDVSDLAAREAKAAVNGSLSSNRYRFSNVKVGASGFGWRTGLIYSSATPLAACSPRGPGSRGMILIVDSPPLRDSFPDGPATALAVGLDLMGNVLVLSVTYIKLNGFSML